MRIKQLRCLRADRGVACFFTNVAVGYDHGWKSLPTDLRVKATEEMDAEHSRIRASSDAVDNVAGQLFPSAGFVDLVERPDAAVEMETPPHGNDPIKGAYGEVPAVDEVSQRFDTTVGNGAWNIEHFGYCNKTGEI